MEEYTAPTLEYIIPSPETLSTARSNLLKHIPQQGLGLERVKQHVQDDLIPAFSKASQSSRYYGFVIGGVTPAAQFADNIVTQEDQNVHVHLPNDTVCTDVEDRALRMLCECLDLDPIDWPHRIFTTGATASNILGLACGREFVINEAVAFEGKNISVAEYGIHDAMRKAGIETVQVLTTVPHSSLLKAASIVGLGHASVRDVSRSDHRQKFDLAALRAALSKPNVASIVSISMAEVNTGFFSTTGAEMQQIRELCDQHGAWLHVDAAFGLLARVLSNTEEYADLIEGVRGLELADSITGDAHKLFNVPYDCGIYLSKHLSTGTQVFQNPNAAYLTTTSDSIPSPLNLGLENSRRFRALPVYSTLAAYGRSGYEKMLSRQIDLARAIAAFIADSADYELLPPSTQREAIYIIVLFRARNAGVNKELVRRINASREIYVSGTSWAGEPAARFAIASWQADVERDLGVIKGVLESAVRQ